MKTLIQTILILTVAASPGLHAQATESVVLPNRQNPGSSPSNAGTQTSDEAGSPGANPDPQLIGTPSRYAISDLENYIATIHSSLAMNDRQRDPFGLVQDPEKVNTEEDLLAKLAAKHTAPKKATPFKDIVAAIPITTIISKKQQFLIGGHSYRVGDTLTLRAKGNVIKVTVTKILPSKITFKNTENNQTATKNIAALPPGMEKGFEKIQPEGVSREGSDEPIDLQLNQTNFVAPRR